MIKKVLVIGSKGQLGQSLIELHSRMRPDYPLIGWDIDEIDITDPQQVAAMVAREDADVIINCAAYTAVDKAETEEDLAWKVNAEGPRLLAEAAKKSGAALLHISTDYVFDGQSEIPYKETDPTAPLGVYGRTKLEGEQAVLASGCRSAIIRTAWLYSEYGHNFLKTMLRLGQEKSEVRVVDDQWGSPTYAGDLAAFILEKIAPSLVATPRYGEIYHYSNQGKTSWADFALKIMETAGLDCRVVPIPTAEYPTPARRPRYSLLEKSKAIHDYHIAIPDWETSLGLCLKKLEKL